MLGKMIGKVIGTKNDRELKRMHKLVDKINALEPKIQPLSDEALKQKTAEFKTQFEPVSYTHLTLPTILRV